MPPRVQDFIRWCLRLIRKAVKAGEAAQVPGRKPESRPATRAALAADMLKIFEAQGVHREAIGAVLLREAAQKEQLTAELIRRLADYLQRAQREPGVRFKA